MPFYSTTAVAAASSSSFSSHYFFIIFLVCICFFPSHFALVPARVSSTLLFLVGLGEWVSVCVCVFQFREYSVPYIFTHSYIFIIVSRASFVILKVVFFFFFFIFFFVRLYCFVAFVIWTMNVRYLHVQLLSSSSLTLTTVCPSTYVLHIFSFVLLLLCRFIFPFNVVVVVLAATSSVQSATLLCMDNLFCVRVDICGACCISARVNQLCIVRRRYIVVNIYADDSMDFRYFINSFRTRQKKYAKICYSTVFSVCKLHSTYNVTVQLSNNSIKIFQNSFE